MIKRKVNNQYTGVYRTLDDVDNFKLRITLKKLYSIIHIPKFEAIQTISSSDQQSTDFEETIEIKWQEKVFSKTEFDYFGQKENCKTENEKRYYQMIKDNIERNENGLLFTYINEDSYNPNDNFGPNPVKITSLRKNVDETHEINENSEELFIDDSSQNEVISSRYKTGKDFTKMFIMADLEPTTLLFTIQYRKSDGLFLIYPDFNDSSNSYYLEIDQNSKQMYTYFMENLSTTSNETTQKLKQKQKLDDIQDETSELIKKMNLSCKDQNFSYPKFSKIVFLLEIIDGENFEYDNIHVQFKIKLPQFVKVSEGLLEASTHSSYKNESIWNFGYCHCLVLDIDDEFMISKTELDTIDIHFDVISIDPLWERERREGIATIKLPLESPKSCQEFELKCFRDLQGGNFLKDFLERFFLGGIRNLKYNDHAQSGVLNYYGNQTISTGVLRVKVQQIRQIRVSYRQNMHMHTIDEIISSYNKAKAKLDI